MKVTVVLFAVVILAFAASAQAWVLDGVWDIGLNSNTLAHQDENAASPSICNSFAVNLALSNGVTSFDKTGSSDYLPSSDYESFDYVPGGDKGLVDLSLAPSTNSTSSTHPGGHGSIQSTSNVYVSPTDSSETPEPATLMLLGAGLVCAAFVRRKIRI